MPRRLPWHHFRHRSFVLMRNIFSINAIGQFTCIVARHVRDGLILRAFAVLPSTKENEFKLRKLLDR